MKRLKPILAALLILSMAGPGFTKDLVFDTSGSHEVVARITGSDCRREYPTFQIGGPQARQFRVKELKAGRSCGTNRPLAYKGFSIWSPNTNGRKIYSYYKSKQGTVSEEGGALNNLTLNPGTYMLVVDGGNGALVQLQFMQ